MDFEFSPKVQDLRKRVMAFMDEFIYPNEMLFREQVDAGNRWEEPAILAELKPRAQEAGLWNLFLPNSYGEFRAASSGRLRYSIAARPIRETWKCWPAMVARHSKMSGWRR
jgi:alkylation response protein AidB-like acyl-CoA dehydrogenase